MTRPALVFMAALAASCPGFASEDHDEAELKQMLLFVLDVETYKGMYYSVQDYCGPKTSRFIAAQAERSWQKSNSELLAGQARAERRYLRIMRERGVEQEATTKLKEVKANTFMRAHEHNRLYKDLIPLKDKHIACAQRLGVMNSDSLSFKKISPDSYRYWQERVGR